MVEREDDGIGQRGDVFLPVGVHEPPKGVDQDAEQGAAMGWQGVEEVHDVASPPALDGARIVCNRCVRWKPG